MLWYEEHPDRLKFELGALQGAGFSYVEDTARRAAGQIVLFVVYPISGVDHQLTVVFPPNYPYFAFHIFAPTLSLAHHQDPYSKLLCFVANIDTEWDASTDTVAKYLLERLPEVIRASEENSNVNEAPEGAPVTGYMSGSFALGSLVITAGWNLPPEKMRGHLLIGLEPASDPNILLRGAVHKVIDLDGNLLGEADVAIKVRYPESLKARWVRLPVPPKSSHPLDVLSEAIDAWPQLQSPVFEGGPDIIGVVFQDEARYKEMHDLWIFVVRRRERHIAPRGRKRLPTGDKFTCYLARPDRGGQDDILTRVPRLRALASKKTTVFGLGALGSSVAWQLARAGIGHLDLVDHDFVQAGNGPRWMIGATAAGFQKASVLSVLIAQNYPFVVPTPIELKVGAPLSFNASREQLALYESLMERALSNTSLIIDCTVEFTVHHFLSDLAWKLGIPYLWASGTPGGWGGIVGRVIPGKTSGCWKCFKRNQKEGLYPSPSAENVTDVHPIGCFSPTFTGSGFDMDSVSLEAVRLAISTLSLSDKDGYPDFDWDIGVVDLWKDGHPISPHWRTFTLEKNKACDAHE